MLTRPSRCAAAFALLVLGLSSPVGARALPESPVALTPPDQFLVDKETDVVAIVKVKRTETRWVILSDGDHLPLLVVDCDPEAVLAGSKAWPRGTAQSVIQHDYSDLLFNRIAPPVIEGRRYVLWALKTVKGGEFIPPAPWMAHPQGFLQIRGEGDGEFVYWEGRSYSVRAIREALASGGRLSLDRIVDPARRLRVAEDRVHRGELGDEKGFIQGLLANVLDPEGEAKKVRAASPSATSNDMFGMSAREGAPHALWFKSLVLLRDLGKDEGRRKAVVAALTPVARTARPSIRLAAALALVDLGSDAGKEALVQGFASGSGPVSSDPADEMTFPGRFPFDGSAKTACAHALARLGDRRGLEDPSESVRLATAEALKDQPDPQLRRALETLSAQLEPKVEALRASGELGKARNPGDYTNRYPDEWVRTQRLLAWAGDDRALRRLVEAYVLDAGTYPAEEEPLMPRGRVVSWSDGPSPSRAIRESDRNAALVLKRLTSLFAGDPRWNEPPLSRLRKALEQPPEPDAEPAARPKPTEAEIAKVLADPDPERRAEGLAAAGYHQMGAFYDKVMDTALNGKGVERNAAVYALGFYGREVPEPALRRLTASDDPELRFEALELATRRSAARFAREAMELVRLGAGLAREAKPDDWEARLRLTYLTRIVCRLARGPIPQEMLDGLKDPDPIVRRVVVESLELSGNPDAVRSLEPLKSDPDPATRGAAEAALATLGPAGP